MILTNDGEFSESLTEPAQKVGKRYLVEVDGVIGQEVVEVFEEGMWFAKEEITTAPAKVELIKDSRCRLIIYEGKHHQVKRMFARFDLKVIALHREAIGGIELPDDLPMGAWRELD
jgi:16S rRNA pseudouridine516 synthase